MEVEPRVLPDSARTAPEAAAAVGTEVGAIVKSLVFRCGDEAVLALVSGANRADEARLEEEFGAPVARADADFARAATGFSIGGVPPLGHPAPLRTLVDEDLLRLRGRVGRRGHAARGLPDRAGRAGAARRRPRGQARRARSLSRASERSQRTPTSSIHAIAPSSGSGVSR